jgi:hypothetical protein
VANADVPAAPVVMALSQGESQSQGSFKLKFPPSFPEEVTENQQVTEGIRGTMLTCK